LESAEIQDTLSLKQVEVNEMGEFEHMLVVFKREMRDALEQRLDEMQQSMLKFQEYYQRRFDQVSDISKKNEEQMNLIECNALRTERYLEAQAAQGRLDNGKSVESSAARDDINDSIIIATSTVSSSTILPSDNLNINNASTTNNNNIDNNDDDNNINDNTESITYVEKESYSNSDNDVFLASEDHDFVSSIQSSTFIGIY